MSRLFSVDLLKLIAAFGVITIHLSPSTGDGELLSSFFSSFAVPYFLVISLFFFIKKVRSLPSPHIGRLRLDRILVPYAVWSLVYVLTRWLKFRINSQSFSVDFIPALFYGGGAVHLYFIPLLLMLQAFAFGFCLIAKGAKCWPAALFAIAGAALFGYLGSVNNFFGFQNAMQTGFLYVLLAFILVLTQSTVVGRNVTAIIGMLFIVLFIACFSLMPSSALLGMWPARPLIGFGISAFALSLPLKSSNNFTSVILSCSYGIFLAHFLFLESFEFALPRIGLELVPYSSAVKIVFSFLIASCSIVFVLIARKSKLLGYLLFGERIDLVR
jgi:peptidoglycan/LPS O-acetylase OafA/YrhL